MMFSKGGARLHTPRGTRLCRICLKLLAGVVPAASHHECARHLLTGAVSHDVGSRHAGQPAGQPPARTVLPKAKAKRGIGFPASAPCCATLAPAGRPRVPPLAPSVPRVLSARPYHLACGFKSRLLSCCCRPWLPGSAQHSEAKA